jgi:hypothetical protein
MTKMTEQVRAILVTMLVVAVMAVLLTLELRGVEEDPCQAWFDRHGEQHPHCLP